MKISYVTIGNALNVHNWSGLEYNIARTLEQYVGELDLIGDLKITKSPFLFPKKMMYRMVGQRYDTVRDPHFARQCSDHVQRMIKSDTDIIFSPGTVATSLLETNKPKVIYSDATFAMLLNFYVFDYCSDTIKKGHYLEQKALDSASLAIYSSEYAAASALEFYKVDPKKVKVVPFGANLTHSFSQSDIEGIINNRSKKEFHLLFLGVNWKRKGGDLALQVVKRLNEMGIKSFLHVVGLKRIPIQPLPDFIKMHGFISKSTEEGNQKILELMKKCHFLLLPSQAEAYGLAFCEANAMGMPSITTNVGGIPTIIKNDINGRMFNPDENPEVIAEYLATYFGLSNARRYQDFAFQSFLEYKNRLNWQKAGESIGELLEEIR